MPRTRRSQSPLAVFLDYVLTVSLAEAHMALEAVRAALAARERVVKVDLPTPARRGRTMPMAATAANSLTSVATPLRVSEPVQRPPVDSTDGGTATAVPAIPRRRRGRPAGSKNAASATQVRRRRSGNQVAADTPTAIPDLPDQGDEPLPYDDSDVAEAES